MTRTRIADLAVYLPERVVPNREIEDRVAMLPRGALERLFGIRERRFAGEREQVSDLAAAAAKPIVERVGSSEIDCLIFAAACSDLIEPATCNIVQHKLGLACPAFDVKNACNSFTTAVMLASSLIQSGQHRNVLVACGEKLSDAIRFTFADEAQLTRHLAGFSLGDAGAAALVARSEDDSGIVYQKSRTIGHHWELCTIRGGGSLHPHDPDLNYFEGNPTALRDVLAGAAKPFLQECLAEAGWKPSDVKHLFTHQVSVGIARLIAELAMVDEAVVELVFPRFGNTAAASIPLAMHQRISRGEVRKGDRVVWLGLAAGVAVSVQLMIW